MPFCAYHQRFVWDKDNLDRSRVPYFRPYHANNKSKVSCQTSDDLFLDIWKPMPLVIFGGSTLLVGFLVLLLRETESDLQETANDAKNQKTEKPEDHKLLDNVE